MIEKIEYNGHTEWRLNGKPHREDGPAREWANGTKEWWQNGTLHREDGPAIENAIGDNYWFISGYHINKIKLDLARNYTHYIGQFLLKKDKDYLIFCFERDNYYFYIVLWKDKNDIDGKRYDCKLEELKSVL